MPHSIWPHLTGSHTARPYPTRLALHLRPLAIPVLALGLSACVSESSPSSSSQPSSSTATSSQITESSQASVSSQQVSSSSEAAPTVSSSSIINNESSSSAPVSSSSLSSGVMPSSSSSVSSAASSSESVASSSSAPAVTCVPNVESGEILYGRRCVGCHGNVPTSPDGAWPGIDAFDLANDGYETREGTQEFLPLGEFISLFMPNTSSPIGSPAGLNIASYIAHTMQRPWCPGEDWPPVRESSGESSSESSSANSSEPDNAEGWVPIFDGESAEGWIPHVRQPTVLEAVNGELHLNSARNLWVVYHELQMSDFEAEVEIHFPDGAAANFNTGFGFRMPTNANNLPTGGLQIETDNGNPSITGSLHVVATTYVYPPGGNRQHAAFAAATRDLFDPNDWIRMRVRAEGNHYQIWVNDRLITDVTYAGRTSGAFGIQHHGGTSGTVRFRNMRAREL